MWGQKRGPIRGEMRVGRRHIGDTSGAHAEGPNEGCVRPRCKRGAHVEHASHIRDAGRVEAQRLVER